MDITDRRDFYTTAELQRMFAGLPAEMQQRYTAYAAGVNAYVDYINSHPTQIPAEYLALGAHAYAFLRH